MIMEYVIYILIGINLITYLIFGIDKVKAKNKSWRIPEKTLFTLAFFGGSVGAVIGMIQFRHKTQKSEFKNIIYLIIFVQLALIAFVAYQFYNNK
ncbi:DUF1294 domain-containing protein [Faecalibacter macacae]|uniref:DUF1294 domain-containing protein n=2 Tax=Faecalibacter macacae TaxID=1859289 RepID=A0A3L9M4L7_9FLAO|nr:DUF1294 domain-containing protein [Faecalibacter macacae]